MELDQIIVTTERLIWWNTVDQLGWQGGNILIHSEGVWLKPWLGHWLFWPSYCELYLLLGKWQDSTHTSIRPWLIPSNSSNILPFNTIYNPVTDSVVKSPPKELHTTLGSYMNTARERSFPLITASDSSG
jgi:hypothetical protein